MVNLQLRVVTKTVLVRQFGLKKNVCNNESILRMEDRKRRTKEFLLNFHKSHFFVMNAESGELRWSKKCFVAAYTNLDENKIIWKKKEEALILTLISVVRTLLLSSLRKAQGSVEEGLVTMMYFWVLF